jgi:hypothetical protein
MKSLWCLWAMCVCVFCVSPVQHLNQLTDFHETWFKRCHWRPPKRRAFQFPAISKNNIVDARTSEVETN